VSAFAGIGMGAIQTGLFLPRALEAGMKTTLLVRDGGLAARVDAAGEICVNLAGHDGLATLSLPDVRAIALTDPACCEILTEASEVAIAVSSIGDYPGLAGLLAEATLRKAAGEGGKCLLYACQNESGAASALTETIIEAGGVPGMFQVLDMVIGKMSRTLRDPDEIARLGLARSFPGATRSWLVEVYDRIHISRVATDRGIERRLPRLEEHGDLQPFEAAKLNGHNAAHAALAYAGRLLGLQRLADVLECPPVLDLVRDAFLLETGTALQLRFGDRDALFSEGGWTNHCDALFRRMANPWLNDDCGRVGRHPDRKLGWHDRLVGTVRLVEATGVSAERWRLALHCAIEACGFADETLIRLWKGAGASDTEITAMLQHQQRLAPAYTKWRNATLPFSQLDSHRKKTS